MVVRHGKMVTTNLMAETKHQVARGSRPDAQKGRELLLFKKVSSLRLTYQIKLLTYMATSRGLRLSIHVPNGSTISPSLEYFCVENSKHVRIVRA